MQEGECEISSLLPLPTIPHSKLEVLGQIWVNSGSTVPVEIVLSVFRSDPLFVR